MLAGLARAAPDAFISVVDLTGSKGPGPWALANANSSVSVSGVSLPAYVHEVLQEKKIIPDPLVRCAPMRAPTGCNAAMPRGAGSGDAAGGRALRATARYGRRGAPASTLLRRGSPAPTLQKPAICAPGFAPIIHRPRPSHDAAAQARLRRSPPAPPHA
jgi:hypothetical protein